ncbi:GNAT family N-acetyltransferase [Paenibacillus sp. VCA1]|uniref:GNAT family N-acetyltransferase n=1 Tax=Paenibacillus sp. VCA1 TaxID=3039148 RepID=UPI00287291AD|nr:GNAT family N-acetyltransferase [Paenibacillus sp. VCA1]MDR9856502.1 GNAT family N-acetyltransferase [Paenibacillus sp. VCA1]
MISRSSKEESSYVRNRLIEFNAGQLPDDLKNRYEEINLHVKDDEGNIIAGLLSVMCWNWLEVDILWVDPRYRKQEQGSKLLMEAEKIAREKGCTFIKLNTFSFQAPEFYKKHGYREIAVIDDAPRGFKHYYFKKDL